MKGAGMAANIAEITNDNFETKVLKSEKPIMIDLWAEWCMPCKMLTPVIEEIAEEYKGRVDVAKVNVDDSPELATELSVMSIPTLIFFKKGKEAGRLTGVNTKEYIIGKIKEFFSL